MITRIVRIVEVMGWIALAAALFVHLPPWWTEILPPAAFHPIELLCELVLTLTLPGFVCSLLLIWCTTELTPRTWSVSMERVPPGSRLDALVSCTTWLAALLGTAFSPTGFG